MTYKIEKTDEQWKALLREKGAEPLAFEVTRHEPPNVPTPPTGGQQGARHLQMHMLRQALFDSSTKFESGCGWPSYFQPMTRRPWKPRRTARCE